MSGPELKAPEVAVPEHVWDAVLEVATIERCYEAAQEKTGWDVATLVQDVVEATVTAMGRPGSAGSGTSGGDPSMTAFDREFAELARLEDAELYGDEEFDPADAVEWTARRLRWGLPRAAYAAAHQTLPEDVQDSDTGFQTVKRLIMDNDQDYIDALVSAAGLPEETEYEDLVAWIEQRSSADSGGSSAPSGVTPK